MANCEVKNDINYQTKLFIDSLNQLTLSIEKYNEIINYSFYGNLDKFVSRPFAWKIFLQILKPNSDSLFDLSSLVNQQIQLNKEYQSKLKTINSKKIFQGDPLANSQDVFVLIY